MSQNNIEVLGDEENGLINAIEIRGKSDFMVTPQLN